MSSSSLQTQPSPWINSLSSGSYRHANLPEFSNKVTAGVPFTQIFGNDKWYKLSEARLNKMSKRFGDMVPKNFLGPEELLLICMQRRGQDQKALEEFSVFIKQKCGKKIDFGYDMNDGAPKPEFEDFDDIDNDFLGERKAGGTTAQAERSTHPPV